MNRTLMLLIASILLGILCIVALYLWSEIFRRVEAVPIPEIKRLLIKEAELEKVHHEVYVKVGEELWEEAVKPAFMKALVIKTVQATGKLIPSTTDIIKWIRTHPEEAEELMKYYGAQFKKVYPK